MTYSQTTNAYGGDGAWTAKTKPGQSPKSGEGRSGHLEEDWFDSPVPHLCQLMGHVIMGFHMHLHKKQITLPGNVVTKCIHTGEL